MDKQMPDNVKLRMIAPREGLGSQCEGGRLLSGRSTCSRAGQNRAQPGASLLWAEFRLWVLVLRLQARIRNLGPFNFGLDLDY